MKKIVLCLLVFFNCGLIVAQKAAPLKFTSEGKFKIVHFADMHYVVGSDETKKVMHIVNQTLDEEKPQMVVFTGDVVTSAPQKQGWTELLAPIISRRIPWAVTFGNHDDEYDLKRKELMDFIVQQPYTLAKYENKKLKGATNYVVDVAGNSGKNAAVIYCLDSNSYSTIDSIKGYGWFGFDQVEWFRGMSKKRTAANGGKPLPSLAFFHIPVPEYRYLTDTVNHVVYGTRKENECPAAINTGLFAAFVENADVMGTFVGHDHDNNYIGVANMVSMAYGQYSGGNTVYNNIGSGARVIELTEGKREFDTWIRMSDNTVKDKYNYPNSFKKK